MGDTYEEFMDAYADGKYAARVFLDANIDDLIDEDGTTPFLILHSKHGTWVLNPQRFNDYTFMDVHAFDADGNDARTGVMGMDREGVARMSLPDSAPGKSHGWPAAGLIALFLGDDDDLGDRED